MKAVRTSNSSSISPLVSRLAIDKFADKLNIAILFQFHPLAHPRPLHQPAVFRLLKIFSTFAASLQINLLCSSNRRLPQSTRQTRQQRKKKTRRLLSNKSLEAREPRLTQKNQIRLLHASAALFPRSFSHVHTFSPPLLPLGPFLCRSRRERSRKSVKIGPRPGQRDEAAMSRQDFQLVRAN